MEAGEPEEDDEEEAGDDVADDDVAEDEVEAGVVDDGLGVAVAQGVDVDGAAGPELGVVEDHGDGRPAHAEAKQPSEAWKAKDEKKNSETNSQ